MEKDICVITSLFALVDNSYYLTRYREFEANLKKQGIPLYTIELALNDNPFLLKEHESFMRMRTDSFLWHKESLLNIIAKKVPERFTKIAWLDADILIENDDWANEASRKLEEYNLLQIGSRHISYDKYEHVELDKKTFGWGYQNGSEQNLLRHYRLGLGWAVKRDFFYKVGMFDEALESKDSLTIMALIDFKNKKGQEVCSQAADSYSKNCPKVLHYYHKYMEIASNYNGGRGCGYTEGKVIHKYHAPICRRGYQTRYALSKGLDIDKDLERDVNGLWRWKNEKFHNIWKKYFEVKNTHDTHLNSNEIFLVRGQKTFNWKSIID